MPLSLEGRCTPPDFSRVALSSYLNLAEPDNLCLVSLAPLLGTVLYFSHFGILAHHFISSLSFKVAVLTKIAEIRSVFKYVLGLYMDLVLLLLLLLAHHLGDCILLC